MTINEFSSPLADYFCEFVRMKRSLGYKYDADNLYYLRALDKLCSEHSEEGICFSQKIVQKWMEPTAGQSLRVAKKKARFSNEIAEFLQNRQVEVYFIPIRQTRYASASMFVPYVFSHSEIERILKATDNHPAHRAHPLSNKQYSFLFRLLYCCGLRISEALELKHKDIDIENQVLTIYQGKFNKDRLVPISATLSSFCEEFLSLIKQKYPENPYIFPSRNKLSPISSRCVYEYYRKILWEAGIPHGGKGVGPRLHDLRHTFAVHSLQNWVKNGTDIYTALPILANYLGHDSIKITEKYLRLTSELYPEITSQVEKCTGHVLQEVKFYETD